MWLNEVGKAGEIIETEEVLEAVPAPFAFRLFDGWANPNPIPLTKDTYLRHRVEWV